MRKDSQTMKKYPIGIQSFSNIRENNYIYVDKTDLVYQLAQEHVCFLCRPRRFGKSLLLSTLEAYFSGEETPVRGVENYGFRECMGKISCASY